MDSPLALAGMILLTAAACFPWRGLGVLLSGRIDPNGAAFRWVGCVAYAMLAGLFARFIVLPGGALEAISPGARLATCVVAVAVYFLAGRRMPAALGGGLVAYLIAGRVLV
ncbi:MAG: AzlD domain-containing protein [Alphaproteobacteria bacterium]